MDWSFLLVMLIVLSFLTLKLKMEDLRLLSASAYWGENIKHKK
jgi:hypothetical protein